MPADSPLAHVHLVQPDVGLADQSLLHELPTIGHEEKLRDGERERERERGREMEIESERDRES